MKKIAVALPAYTGQIHVATTLSLIAEYSLFKDRGDDMRIIGACGNAMIAHCRNMLVAQFLASDADDLVMIDHDLAWEAGAVMRLVDHPVDFVAGVYPARKDPIEYLVSYIDKPELWADPETGLLEVEGISAGFLRLSRSCLERMTAAYPELEFSDPNAPNGSGVALFDNMLINKLYHGEDMSFCRRWRAIDGQIWIDPELTLTHIGNKSFVGCIGDWLRNR